MKTFVRLISVCSMVSLGVVAVPITASADEAARSEEVDTSSAALHSGARKVFEKALADVELRPEQEEAVGKLKAEAKERHAPVREARRGLMLAVAEQIEKGKIDRCALAPEIKKVASAMAEARPGDREAMEKLHSILDPDQRTRFVDALKRHWESHQKSFDAAAMTDKISRELDLTDDQKDKVRHILSGLKEIAEAEPAHAEHRALWSRILEAFKGDHFDLDEVAPSKDVAEKTTKRIEGHLWAAEALLPVLTEQQRGVLADKLRSKAQGHHNETERGASSGMDMD
ncbi:MAG: Spy/CpxP family protein refolding chaperone [Labilithrix sp.]|nr:Spy/CpxP family protein refolding chaperone [Labilithrix sp.]MBX3219256.1 Spy/CpxP family protein refolding chaperone [Labilithrix sp.]